MTQKNFQNANLTDALVFAMAMEDPENCRDTLQVILQKKLGKFKVHVEHSLLFNSDYRSIRLDVYGEDEDGEAVSVHL